MKFNLSKDRLTRILLSANPVLANCKGSKKAVRLFMNMLGMKCIVILPHAENTEIPLTNDTDYIKLYVSNVTDAQLQPVKSVLAKQLQELLPINMIVLPDNIIGCAANE